MHAFLSLLILLLLGTISAHFAKKRNQDPYIWFFVGFCSGVLGLIILFIIPPKNEDKLSPILSSSQLDNTPPPPVEPTTNTLDFSNKSPEQAMTKNLWYYLNEENKQYGPMSFSALKRAWENDQIKGSTLVWSQEMESWQSLETLEEIFSLIRNNPKIDQTN